MAGGHRATASSRGKSKRGRGRHHAQAEYIEPQKWLGAGAITLGLGAGLASGSGFAHAEGPTDNSAGGPTAPSSPDSSKGDGTAKGPAAVESPTTGSPGKTLVPGLFTVPKMNIGKSRSVTTVDRQAAVGDPGSLPGLIAGIPQNIAAALVPDALAGAGRASTSAPVGHTAPQASSRGSTGHNAVLSPTGKTTGGETSKVASFPAHSGSQPLDVMPSSPDPIPLQRLDVSASPPTTPGPVTAFPGAAPRTAAQGGPVAAVVSALSASLSGTSSGSGGSPVAPMPIMTAALQLIRRESTTPSLAPVPSFTTISTLFTPAPAPVLPTHPSAPSTTSTPPLPGDVAPTPYGNIGKWMLQSNGQVSNYGGQPYGGKTLIEPVNVIIVDPNSKSAAETTAKVNKAMILGGFPPQPVHSGGFMGKINDTVYGQQPGGLINAYSDNLFVVQNDHGRLFGPAPAPGGGYVWTGAFSTETPTIYNGLPAHAYVSSNAARDTLALRLLASGQVKSISYVPLNNAYNTPTTTTGDHDGYAAVIVLK